MASWQHIFPYAFDREKQDKIIEILETKDIDGRDLRIL